MIKKKIIFIILINLTLVGIQFYLTCRRASDGEKMAALQAQHQQLEADNSQLKNLIFQATSLSEIAKRAAANQFVPLKTTSLAPVSVAAAFSNQP